MRFCPANFLENAPENSLHSMTLEGAAVMLSTPERAALEMLYLVPREAGFSEALEVVGGLAALRVDLMRGLLENCSSVKIKRLFLYCAREAGHSWYPVLDHSRIDLGAGKRELVKGGKLDKEFPLTVAASLHPTEIQF